MKFVLGLTGPTGAGKSTLCKTAEDFGFYVIDCDKIARQVTGESACLSALTDAFGKEILNDDNTLNRKALAKAAFSSPVNTELLNRTILPFIVDKIEKEIALSKSDRILLDAPTLYESGADSFCDAVCAVLTDKETRLSRIISRDNISEEEALLRINAGKSDEYYKSKTQNIIYNDAGVSAMREEFSKLINKLLGGK